MGRTERREIIKQIEETRKSRVICYLTSDRPNAEAAINKDVLPLFYEHLESMGDAANIDLFIYTSGGDTLAAFGIARLLREFSNTIGVLIPQRCHSAGSLIALGANSIVMLRGATLSPIDPSIMGPLNPVIEPPLAPQRQVLPLSVESVAGFKDLVTQDWDIKGEEALTAAFRMLAEKVHPLALGNVYRARQQIEELAKTLLADHRSDEDNVTKIVKTLTRGLGSHDYPLSRRQARALFGSQLAQSDPELERLLWLLYLDFAAEMELRSPFDPNVLIQGQQALRVTQKLAIIETATSADVAERELALRQLAIQAPLQIGPMGPLPVGSSRVTQAEVVRAGWSHYV